ncbi:MAG: hypothetical protein ACI4XS_02165, partial [Bacillus sp. (in: firmicutes)]
NQNTASVANTMNEEVEEARLTVIGRIITLGGSVLFLIGSLVAVIAGVKVYNRLVSSPSSS